MENRFCPEHYLLNDERWEQYLRNLNEKTWDLQDFENCLKALKINLKAPVYKQCNGWKVDRIADLNLQIKRIQQFMESIPKSEQTTSGSQDTLKLVDDEEDEFIPYVPLLNP